MACKIDEILDEVLGKLVDHKKSADVINAIKSRYVVKKGKVPKDHSYFLKPQDGTADGVDIYSTPVKRMKHGIKVAIKAVYDADPDGDKESKQLAKSKDITELFEMFGPDESNNKLWRNMMKPLVMVYIYGAQITSIKKKAGNEFGMFAVNKAIKSFGNRTFGEVYEIAMNDSNEDARAAQLLMSVISKATSGQPKFKTFNSEMNIDVDYEGDIMLAPIKDLYLDDDSIDGISRLMSNVIGDSIEDSFLDSFGFIDDYRKSVKNVEMVNYLLFKFEMRKKLEKYVNNDGVLMVNADILDKVFAELDDEGKFVGAVNSRGAKQDYKKFDQQDRGRSGITGRLWNGYLSENTKTVTVKGKNVTANPGAVGVTAIHDMDGFLMYLSNNEDFQNIFDAYIVGLDLEKGQRTSDTYNFNVIDLSRKHSILHNAVQKVSGQLAEMKKDKEDYEKFIESIGEDESGTMQDAYKVIDAEFDGDSVDRIVETLQKIDTQRNDNINGNVTVGHMHVSSSFPALEIREDTEVDGKKSTKADKKFADFDNISEVLGELIRVVNDTSKKPEKKNTVIAGHKIEFTIDDSIRSLTSNNTKRGIRIRSNSTVANVIRHLQGIVVKTDDNIIPIENDAIKNMMEDGVNLIEIVGNMDDNTVRKFLLLREFRRNGQRDKSSENGKKFIDEYNDRPAVFEKDANIFALKALGIIENNGAPDATVVEWSKYTVSTDYQEISQITEDIDVIGDTAPSIEEGKVNDGILAEIIKEFKECS